MSFGSPQGCLRCNRFSGARCSPVAPRQFLLPVPVLAEMVAAFDSRKGWSCNHEARESTKATTSGRGQIVSLKNPRRLNRTVLSRRATTICGSKSESALGGKLEHSQAGTQTVKRISSDYPSSGSSVPPAAAFL